MNSTKKLTNLEVPRGVFTICKTIEEAGYQAYLVGGCVRDLVLGREPKDWDVATSAKPDEIQKIFPESVYENSFGTVLVKIQDPQSAIQDSRSTIQVVEVTTFRLEGKYTDRRHPDEIKFAKTIEEDLSRRDFTINALALSLIKGKLDGVIAPCDFTINALDAITSDSIKNKFNKIVDPYNGQKDLKEGIIRTVGVPEERFSEDALRLMRAVRFSSELGFELEFNTRRAIEKQAGLLEMIAKERIRDELIKIVSAPFAAKGIILLEELDLLRYVIPELREGLGAGQNKHHIYSVFEHNIRSLDYAVKKNYPLLVRFAALFHDVGKPRSKRGEGSNSTFYNHEMIGAKMTLEILDRLRFPKSFIEKCVHLVRQHLFYYNVDEVTEAGVRRLLRRVGPENVDDLMKVREADRIGSGVPKAVPYKLRHLLFMIEKVKNDPLSPKMLKVKGDDVMKILKIQPGPKIGYILNILLEEVLDDPKNNTQKLLESEIVRLGKLSEKELVKLAKKAKETKEKTEENIKEEIKNKYYVK